MSVSGKKSSKPKPNWDALPPELRDEAANAAERQESLPPAEDPIDYHRDVTQLINRLEANRGKSIQLENLAYSPNPVSDSPLLDQNIAPERLTYLAFVEKLARAGLTVEQVSDVLGVPVKRFSAQLKRDRVLGAMFNRGKAEADRLVAESLFRRALGFSYDEITIESSVDGEGAVTAKEKRTRKFIPPDVQAQMAWLTNRDGQNWKSTVNIKDSDTKKIIVVRELQGLGDDELEKLAKESAN